MNQPKRAWVVVLKKRRLANGRPTVQIDQKYVRARTREGAVRTAKLNSFMSGVKGAFFSVRLADPVLDLGCRVMK